MESTNSYENFARFSVKRFIVVTLVVSVWVQISETVRYFVFVQNEMRSYFAKMNLENLQTADFLIVWIIWGAILTALTILFYRIYSLHFGSSIYAVFFSATVSWLFFFGLFWVGLANMGLSRWSFIPIPLFLSWLELLIATVIGHYLFKRFDRKRSAD